MKAMMDAGFRVRTVTWWHAHPLHSTTAKRFISGPLDKIFLIASSEGTLLLHTFLYNVGIHFRAGSR